MSYAIFLRADAFRAARYGMSAASFIA